LSSDSVRGPLGFSLIRLNPSASSLSGLVGESLRYAKSVQTLNAIIQFIEDITHMSSGYTKVFASTAPNAPAVA
jgi:hypothetical protein